MLMETDLASSLLYDSSEGAFFPRSSRQASASLVAESTPEEPDDLDDFDEEFDDDFDEEFDDDLESEFDDEPDDGVADGESEIDEKELVNDFEEDEQDDGFDKPDELAGDDEESPPEDDDLP